MDGLVSVESCDRTVTTIKSTISVLLPLTDTMHYYCSSSRGNHEHRAHIPLYRPFHSRIRSQSDPKYENLEFMRSLLV